MELEDLEDLINLAVPAEERLLLYQLGEDAAHCPNIHPQTVLPLPQQHLRRAVPERLNLMSEGLDGYAKSAGKSKISNLQHP